VPTSTWNLQWLNHNSQRHYPLSDGAGLEDTTGSFRLPDDFLVELDLPIHAAMDMNPGGFFIRAIGVFPTGYSLTVAHDDGETVVDVATALIPRASHVRNRAYALGGIEPFEDTIGKVVVGRLESIDQQPPGLWLFDLAGSRLEADCIRPIIRGLQALIVVNGTERSLPLVGDIEIVPGENMQITPVIVEGEDPRLVFSAIYGEGTVEECVCEGESAALPCIKTINGIQPTIDGEISLIGDDCIQVQANETGIKLVDCVQPCCDCEDLETLTQRLEDFNQQRVEFIRFNDRLRSSVDEFSLTVLGARLGDQGCITCT
jgi:hypothetical protein